MAGYQHQKIEKKWQKEWKKRKVYQTKDKERGKRNFYTLVEFPYPSGNLHTGHWYAFSVPDIFVRAKRRQGYNVMFPIGFDAFGLPAENAAIKRKLNPRKWTYSNIEYMREQLCSMGASFDWSREVVTCDPAYYRWTQWLFVQLFKAGLAYQAETPVNWCPSCKTVLANEQVAQGRCERCSHEVIQKNMKQWMLRITKYADRLIDDLEKLDWPNEIKEAQRNWIGKSDGAAIDFLLKFDFNNNFLLKSNFNRIGVFTTRPDTLFGATYLVLAPEHLLIEKLKSSIKNWREVEVYVKKARSKTELERQRGEKEKTGVELKGIKAINPATKKEIPIWISDYVLAGYGTGAIMAVPAHDERDFEFAKKFGLPIRQVIQPENQDLADENSNSAYTGSGTLINSGKFNGMNSEDAKRAITEFVGGKITSQYKLRDWVVSRQRYWGVPIPVIHCVRCGVVPVPDKDLPVKLPEIKDYLPTGDGKSPLVKVKTWVAVKCPLCKKAAAREIDTLDTFVDSSWYFLRYCDPENKKKFADANKMKLWMPVDLYSGGAEHTTMHLLYSRFFVKVLYDLKLVELDEPYLVRKNRGIILGLDGQKMSKSRGNVVEPDEYVKKLGADTVRMYLAFIGPYSEVGSYPWDQKGILGIRRFLDRVWNMGEKLSSENSELSRRNHSFSSRLTLKGSPPCRRAGDASQKTNNFDAVLSRLLHKTIKKVTEDIETFHFNTAISQLMILLNKIEKFPVIRKFDFEIFLQLLAPFAPHLTEELWHQLEKSAQGRPASGWKSIHLEPWPKFDPKLLVEETFELIVQVNGKVRDRFTSPSDVSQEEATRLTLERKKVKNILGTTKPRMVIFVPKRLINLVV